MLYTQSLAPRLTRLDLGHCSNLTDSGVAKLAALTVLRALSLKDCIAVTDAGELRGHNIPHRTKHI